MKNYNKRTTKIFPRYFKANGQTQVIEPDPLPSPPLGWRITLYFGRYLRGDGATYVEALQNMLQRPAQKVNPFQKLWIEQEIARHQKLK